MSKQPQSLEEAGIELRNSYAELGKAMYELLKPVLDKAAEFMIAVWKVIKTHVENVVRQFNKWLGRVLRIPGYIRMANRKKIEEYKAMSYGKSNNWRKLHMLPLARRRGR